MDFLAASVLNGGKFLPNLIKRGFIEMASKFLLHVSDFSEKVLQNAIEWCLFDLHRMLSRYWNNL